MLCITGALSVREDHKKQTQPVAPRLKANRIAKVQNNASSQAGKTIPAVAVKTREHFIACI